MPGHKQEQGGSSILFEKVVVAGVVHIDAPHRIPSTLFEERLEPTLRRLGLPASLIRHVAGIEARRWFGVGGTPSAAATEAAEKLFAVTGIDRKEVGILVNTSVCRDFIEPSTASLVHGNLGLGPQCLNLDLGNACLAFLNAMDVVAMILERGEIDYGLIVDGEVSRFVQEKTLERLSAPDVDEATFRSQFATLTLGSGSVAMLMSRKELVPDGHRYRGGVSIAATEWNHLCHGQVDIMQTDMQTLLLEGTKLACRTFDIARKILGWNADVLDELVMHQVSAVHTVKLCEALGLDPSRAFLTFPEFGNMGPASLPITLSKAVQAKRIRRGMRVGLLGIGSGLNCAMAELVW